MTAYTEHFAAHLRLAILRELAEAPEYSLNSSLLAAMLRDLGLSATRDQVLAQLAWLAEQGLAATRPGGDHLVVGTASERGLDVAAGRATTPGVARPGPRTF